VLAVKTCSAPSELHSNALVNTLTPEPPQPTPTYPISAPSRAQPSRGEGALWVDQWVNAAKQLNQWDALQEYAGACDNNALLADSYWRLSEWERLRDVLVGVGVGLGGGGGGGLV